MATDAMADEELRFCFNIDVTEDEFYKNNEVKTFYLILKGGRVNLRPLAI